MIFARFTSSIIVSLVCLNLGDHGSAAIMECDQRQEQKIAAALQAVESHGRVYLNYINKKNKKRHYTRYEGELSFPKTGLSHKFLYYETKTSPTEKAPLVIIYPGIRGTTFFEKYLAGYYASRGVSAVISHYMDDEALYYIRNIRPEMLSNISVGFSLIDFFSNMEAVDADRISILGVSYGGIRGAYHTALDKRIKSATLMVAGAPFEEILAFSDLALVKKIRNQQMSHAVIENHDDYLKRVKAEIIPITDFICQRKTEEFYLIISEEDRWVPTSNQWHLWELLGRPQHERSGLGHVGAPLWLGIIKIKNIFNFFASIWNFTFDNL